MFCTALPEAPLPRLSNRDDIFVFRNDWKTVLSFALEQSRQRRFRQRVQNMNLMLGLERGRAGGLVGDGRVNKLLEQLP